MTNAAIMGVPWQGIETPEGNFIIVGER